MFGSYFFSILLHLALALLIFLWPSSPPVRLDQPMMQISVNMGAPGGNRMASPVLGPQGKPMPTKAAPQPAPAEQAASAVPVAVRIRCSPRPSQEGIAAQAQTEARAQAGRGRAGAEKTT